MQHSSQDVYSPRTLQKLIIKTSDLGYTNSVYEVATTATKKEIEFIEFETIPTQRHNSTTIEQLKGAVEDAGLVFDYKVIVEDIKPYEVDKSLKIDYFAHAGNY